MSDTLPMSIPPNRISEQVEAEANKINNVANQINSLGRGKGSIGMTPQQILESVQYDLSKELKDDNVALKDLIRARKLQIEGLAGFKNLPKRLQQELDAIQMDLEATIDEQLTSFTTTDGLEILIDQMITTMMEGLKPLTSLPEMPPLPLVDSLVSILKCMATVGSAVSKAEDEMKNKVNLKTAGDLIQEAEDHYQDYYLDKSDKDSVMKKLGDKILEVLQTIWEILKLIPQYIQCFFYLCLKELLDLLKPVFQAFGLVLGTCLSLVERVGDLIFNTGQFLMWCWHALIKSLSKKLGILGGLCQYAINPSIGINEQILIMQREVVKVESSLEYTDLLLKQYAREQAAKSTEELKKNLENGGGKTVRIFQATKTAEEQRAEEQHLKDKLKQTTKEYERAKKAYENATKEVKEFLNSSKEEMEKQILTRTAAIGIDQNAVKYYLDNKYKVEKLDTSEIDKELGYANSGFKLNQLF